MLYQQRHGFAMAEKGGGAKNEHSVVGIQNKQMLHMNPNGESLKTILNASQT